MGGGAERGGGAGEDEAAELARLAARFRRFADDARGSSPLYVALAPRVAEDRELLALLLAAEPTQRIANLLFAAAHDLVLAGVDAPAARYYASVRDDPPPPDGAAFAAFRELCLGRRAELVRRIATRRTQTNEVARSAVLLACLRALAGLGPIALVDLGASAGLNLLLDRFHVRCGAAAVGPPDSPVRLALEAVGAPPPAYDRGAPGDPGGTGAPGGRGAPGLAYRVGVDERPLDAGEPADARWLEACVWPDQRERLARLRAALALAREAPPRVLRAGAAEGLAAAAEEAPPGLPLVAMHSTVWPYLAPDERAEVERTLARLARRRPVARLALEADALHPPEAAARAAGLGPLPVLAAGERPPAGRSGLLTAVTEAPGEPRRVRLLARADLHGGWIEWLEAPGGGAGFGAPALDAPPAAH